VTYKSFSPKDTKKLAVMFGQEAKRGDIFCLSGALGAGKTVFAKGFAEGLRYKGEVTSPTFTLMNVYEGGRFPIYHFDLYRLEGAEDMESIGYEDYFYPGGTAAGGVCLVEWPERAGDVLPEDAIWIEISENAAQGADYREICLK